MSYSRSFSKTIAIHYSGSVSYPASQSGGSVSYSGTAYEDVVVNINVDTDAFDSSVRHCNNSVGALTGAVVATEGAQVASIRQNAIKIGQTIVDGFFSTVRSEISQQITELKNRIDADLIHLNELAKRCVDKQRQMESDYNRISGRYLKIFSDLDNELDNRIHEIDRPVFEFRQRTGSSSYRALDSDLAGGTAVAGAENSRLEAQISASVAKKRAFDTIRKANHFLARQKQTDRILEDCIMEENATGDFCVPVCYMETSGEGGRTDKKVYSPIAGIDEGKMADRFCSFGYKTGPEQETGNIRMHFDNEVSSGYGASSASHDARVREYIVKLFNIDTIQMIQKI